MRTIDREVPKGLAVHMILDNYGTHKHAGVKKWLAKHPRFHLHFTPTSSSWLNLVERWFRDLTDKAIRRGVFYSVDDLISDIENYLRVKQRRSETVCVDRHCRADPRQGRPRTSRPRTSEKSKVRHYTSLVIGSVLSPRCRSAAIRRSGRPRHA